MIMIIGGTLDQSSGLRLLLRLVFVVVNVFMYLYLISQDDTEFSVPSYPTRINESEEALRARLTYQSRKRGIAENCLILRFVLYFIFRIFSSSTKLFY